jgi:CheY-like chemotaxis protein
MTSYPHGIAATSLGQCTILLIEDDRDDVYLYERAFAHFEIRCTIHNVESVASGIDYLEGKEPYSDRSRFPIPDLIITDLGFRGDSGLRFLNWLRSQSQFQHVPIVCITGSMDPEKLEQARNFGARTIEKSADFHEMVGLIRDLLPTPG